MKRFNHTHSTLTRLLGAGMLVTGLSTANLLVAADPQGVPTTQGSGAASLTGETPSKGTMPSGRGGSHATMDSQAVKESPSAPHSPQHFIKEAAQCHSAEVALSELAQRKSQNAEVKRFAEHMARDHREANRKLQPLVQAHGLSLHQPMEPKHQQTIDRLQGLRDAEFDREYMRAMLKDHQMAVTKFTAAVKSENAQVRQYAQETLPKLREHLQHAMRTAKAAGLDDSTISALSGHPSSKAAGGALDSLEQESGASSEVDVKHHEQKSDPEVHEQKPD